MRTATRVWATGVAVLALGSWFLWSGSGTAGEDKDIRDAVLKIADAFEKGNADAAKTQAEALAGKVEDLEQVMNLFKPRKEGGKGGVGVGKVHGEVTPDGIELKLIAMGRDAPTQGQLNKEGQALERMAYVAAAITEVAIAKAPKEDKGTATVQLWKMTSVGARDTALELAKAVASKSPAAVKAAVTKVNSNCNNCHSEFKSK